jgi:acyl dehydratase
MAKGGTRDVTELPPSPEWATLAGGLTVSGPEQRIDPTLVVLQVSGSQDWNLIHHDADFAAASGHSGVLLNTGWTSAFLARPVTDWAGGHGWLLQLGFQMRKPNLIGDLVQAHAKVTGLRDDDGHLVDLDVWIDNDRVGITTTGNAVVRLP